MRTYNNTDLRFKQINSTHQVENRQAGCSVAFQPEYYAISNLESHFSNK